MYIESYWGSYIGGTDDSLTLLSLLEDFEKDEIGLGEIFARTGLKVARRAGVLASHDRGCASLYEIERGWNLTFTMPSI